MNDSSSTTRNAADFSQSSHSTHFLDPASIWRGKWYVVLALIATLGAGGFYLSQAPPIFEVEARLLVQEETTAIGQDRQLRKDRNFLATQAEILASPVTVQNALTRVENQLERPHATSVEQALASLRVSPVVDTYVLKIGYRSDSPDDAVQLVRAIVGSYQEYARELDKDSNAEMVRMLTQRDKELRKELALLQEEYRQIRENGPLVGQGNDALQVQLALVRDLSERLTETKNRRFEFEHQLQTLAERPAPESNSALRQVALAHEQDTGGEPRAGDSGGQDFVQGYGSEDAGAELVDADGGAPRVLVSQTSLTPVPQDVVADDPVRIQQELWRARGHANDLAQSYGPQHPEMRAARDQIAYWERLLGENERVTARGVTEAIATLHLTEQQLSQLFEAELAKAKSLDVHLIGESQILGNIKRVEELITVNFEQMKKLEFADAASTDGTAPASVHLLNGENLSAVKVWPRPVQFLAMCAAVGLVAGCLLASLADLGVRAAKPVQN